MNNPERSLIIPQLPDPSIAPNLTPWIIEFRRLNPMVTPEQVFDHIPRVHDWDISSGAMIRAGFDLRGFGVDTSQIKDGSM